MSDLLEKGQIVSIIPNDFKSSNKGEVLDVKEHKFFVKVLHNPEGLQQNRPMEFYSPTKNGTLYFSSNVLEIKDNILTVAIPQKHRFLQRRAFSRISFTKELECTLGDKVYSVRANDISVGGIKFVANQLFDLDTDYHMTINLLKDQIINGDIELIRIQKNEDKTYTVSGRFKNLSDVDRMTLIQFCMRRSVELENMNKLN